MPIDLPDPDEIVDVWGEQLNTAIESVEATAEAAATAAATNVSVDTESDADLVINYGENTATLLKTSAVGAPSGVASLDSASQVPVEQLGNLTFGDVGAAAASHQHSLSDLPQVSLTLNAAPAFATFNTTTQQWPFRTDITSDLTKTVVWFGDADIPTYAVPGVDLFYGPRKSGTTTDTPTPPDDPTETPDANGVTLSQPVVTVSGSTYNITATVTTNSNLTFTYLQLAVRGPNGEQQDTGFNNNAVVNSTTRTVTGTGNATTTGNWTVRLAYNITGGAAQSNWVDGLSRTFAIADLGGVPSGAYPPLGRSLFTWNSGVYHANGQVTSCEQFFDWRNREGDAIMYFTGRESFSALSWLRDDLTAWPGYRIIAVSSQPTGQSNAATAAGTNNAFWVQYGLNLKNKGWNDGRTIVRLNWEANGNWYSWSWVNGGAAQYVNAFKNVVNSIRVHAPLTKFDFCLNKDSQNGGVVWQTQIADPLIGFIDSIGLDHYDHGPAQNTETSWSTAVAQDPGLTSVSTYCRANGLKMSLDEWGLSRGGTGFTGGGDNPFFLNKMWAWINANTDVLAIETYYNDNGAPATFLHKVFPDTDNPTASAVYRATNRWGRA
jgi:hypothetical protein